MVVNSEITERTDNYAHTLIILYTEPGPHDTISKMTSKKQLFGKEPISIYGGKSSLMPYLAEISP